MSKWTGEVLFNAFRVLDKACKDGRLEEGVCAALDGDDLSHNLEAGVGRS